MLFVCGGLLSQNKEQPSTWGGARFGMTEAAAKTLFGQTVSRPSSDEQLVNSRDAYVGAIVKPVDLHGMSGFASLIFGTETKRLVQINLSFQLDKASSSERRNMLAGLLKEDLSGKYGTPISTENCADGVFSCGMTWRSVGQTIKMDILGGNNPLMIIVLYRPVSDKL